MEKTSGGFGLGYLKGLLIGVSTCLAAILVFAFVLKFAELSDGWVKFINQIIKLCGITVACLVGVRGEKGFLKGAALGFSVIAVTYLLFGLISGSLDFGVSTLFEALYGIVCGILAGILSANLKK
ncbi:MAG: TIGR04086 family membrane protein [Clostridia bacterium]|nr:TIGR04086 family membrane protein [Clostridia bacterium]